MMPLGFVPFFSGRTTVFAAGGALLLVALVLWLKAERRQRRQRVDLKKDLALYHQIFAQATVGISMTDPVSGRYLRVNPRFARMLGYAPEELLCMNWRQVTSPDDLEENLKKWQGLLRGASAELVDTIRYRHRDGHDVMGRVHVTILRDEAGTPIRTINFVNDLTELLHSEQERQQLERQLFQAQKLEAMGQLVGGVAHDFNNILAVILGYTGLALRRFARGPEEKLAQYLSQVNIAGERGRDLITRLLAYSRGQAREQEQVPPMDCASLVKEAIKMLRAAIPAGIELRLRIGDVSPCCIDPVDLHQVLMNLIINARDAIGNHHGRIDVGLEMVRVAGQSCAVCQAMLHGDYLALMVADTGGGIPAELQSRIFDPFFSTKEPGAGTGLGLSVVQGIVRKVSGHILLDSEPERGARFQVLLPSAAVEEGTTVERVTEQVLVPASEPRQQGRILLVDDEKALVEYLTEVLTEQGHAVTPYSGAAAALSDFCARPETFELLLSDQTMPGLSGLELSRTVRALRPDMPIILMSGNPGAIAGEDLRQLDVSCLIGKPIDADELLNVIDRALRGDGKFFAVGSGSATTNTIRGETT